VFRIVAVVDVATELAAVAEPESVKLAWWWL